MAGKSSKSGSFTGFGDIVIIQLALSADDLVAFHGWSLSDETMWELVEEATLKGVVFTVKPANRGDGFSVSVRATNADAENVNQMFYSNAPTAREALLLSLFKLSTHGISADWKQSAKVASGGYS